MVITNTLKTNGCLQRSDFYVTVLHVVNLLDILNYAYNEVKLPVPSTLLWTSFTVPVKKKNSYKGNTI